MVKVVYLFFWPDFCLEKEPLHRYVFIAKECHVEYLTRLSDNKKEVHEKLSKYDLIVGGCFIPVSHLWIYKVFHSKILLCITEPIEYWHPPLAKMYVSLPFRACYGCVPQSGDRFIKYPLYLWDDLEQKIHTSRARMKTLTGKELINRKFCCLINRHDEGKTRTSIFKALSQIRPIVCPGRLFNNFPNEEFEKIGKETFLQGFLFHICPENFCTNLQGYITEKIAHCVVAGPIPIYTGNLDEIDYRIFNRNRILLYQPDSPLAIEEVKQCIENLLQDPSAMYAFYMQDPFTPMTLKTIDELRSVLVEKVTIILDQVSSMKYF